MTHDFDEDLPNDDDVQALWPINDHEPSVRRWPWSDWTIRPVGEASASVAAPSSPLAQPVVSSTSADARGQFTWRDRWVGWLERWHRRRHRSPSARAWQEALDHFADVYVERDPNPWALIRLLRRNGVPDWANPFPEGHPDHHRYHEKGLLLRDVETLLQGWLAENNALDDLDTIEPNRERMAWLPIEEAMADRALDERIRDRDHQRMAMVRWCAILQHARGKDLDRLKIEVHADNLLTLVLYALWTFDPLPWGLSLPRIAAGAVSAGLIDAGWASVALTQRAERDAQRMSAPLQKPSVLKQDMDRRLALWLADLDAPPPDAS